MPPVNRHRYITLLLTVFISYMAFSLHLVTHSTGNQNSCELCSGHGNPAHAIPVSTQTLQPPATFELVIEPVRPIQTVAPSTHYRQRAPPGYT